MALVLLAVPPAFGQAEAPPCNEREMVLEHLAKKYNEAPVSIGVTTRGGLMEILAAKDGATWTMVITTLDGISCIIAVGENWRTVAPVLGDGI